MVNIVIHIWIVKAHVLLVGNPIQKLQIHENAWSVPMEFQRDKHVEAIVLEITENMDVNAR